MRHRLLVVACVVLLATAASARPLPDPTQPGEHPIGQRTMTFTTTSVVDGEVRPLETLIWYPAVPDTGIPSGNVIVDADVAPGKHPLIVFSHGSCGLPAQSPFLMNALASWGFVVMAPGHYRNTFDNCTADLIDALEDRLADVRFLIDEMLGLAAAEGGPFFRRIHKRRIGVAGHSLGGKTVLRVLANEKRVKAGLSLSPGEQRFDDPPNRRPTMIMVGEIDDQTPPATAARPNYEEVFGKRYYVELANAGHCAFILLCVEMFCGPGCEPENLSLEDSHAITLRYAMPFLLKHVAGKRKYGRLLKVRDVPAGVTYETGKKRRPRQ